MRRKTQKEFLVEAQSIFGNTYDYSEAKYLTSKNKIIIICKKHGRFYQQAGAHLSGSGCPHCAAENTVLKNSKSLDLFIDEANNIHNNKYNYSEAVYLNNKIKVEINCPVHGLFEQAPDKHLVGQGCPVCGGKNKSNTIDFVTQSNIIHDNKYNYSETFYLKNKSKVKIICLTHGIFWQSPEKHLNGQGCPKCGRNIVAGKLAKLCENFIKQANLIHNFIYDYTICYYINSFKKVNIICNVHGIFSQSPSNHLSGNGCPKCVSSISKLETQWLNSLNISEKFRQKYIKINNKNIIVDAFDPATNTIYEFYGDYWHGNPEKFAPNDLNKINKKTYGELYKNTMDREKLIKNAGYNIVSVWEKDFK